jgi:hypothetical protein
MDERKKKNTCCDGYVLVFFMLIQQILNILRYEMGKYALFVAMCEFMCKKKTNYLGFKKTT